MKDIHLYFLAAGFAWGRTWLAIRSHKDVCTGNPKAWIDFRRVDRLVIIQHGTINSWNLFNNIVWFLEMMCKILHAFPLRSGRSATQHTLLAKQRGSQKVCYISGQTFRIDCEHWGGTEWLRVSALQSSANIEVLPTMRGTWGILLFSPVDPSEILWSNQLDYSGRCRPPYLYLVAGHLLKF